MIQADLVVPPIIAGLLVLLIFGVNAFVMESSIDTRVTNDVQATANLTVDILHEELRQLSTIEQTDNSESDFRFVTSNQDTVRLRSNGPALEIIKSVTAAAADTLSYELGLEDLRFTMEPGNFLKISVSVASSPEQHARRNDNEQVVRGFAERMVYLRNLDL